MEDEEEFELFIQRLNEKNLKRLEQEEEIKQEVHVSPVKHNRNIAVLDQSSIHHDISQMTPYEENQQHPPPKFSIRIKEQSALEYGASALDEEVESIMSSAKKLPPTE